jgi:hypothetical protein
MHFPNPSDPSPNLSTLLSFYSTPALSFTGVEDEKIQRMEMEDNQKACVFLLHISLAQASSQFQITALNALASVLCSASAPIYPGLLSHIFLSKTYQFTTFSC